MDKIDQPGFFPSETEVHEFIEKSFPGESSMALGGDEATPSSIGEPTGDSDVQKRKARATYRQEYRAEAKRLIEQMGTLEEVRQRLGVSRRQICRLLMVDPSAWTRWTKNPSSVPPHIYRALQWYLALVEKDSSWHPASQEVSRRLSDLEAGFARFAERMNQRLILFLVVMICLAIL